MMARPFPGLEWADMPAQIVGDLSFLARTSANQSRDMRTISARNVIQYLDSITQDASGRLDPERMVACGYAHLGSSVIVARKIIQNFLNARARECEVREGSAEPEFHWGEDACAAIYSRLAAASCTCKSNVAAQWPSPVLRALRVELGRYFTWRCFPNGR